jgi:hypothetical protein
MQREREREREENGCHFCHTSKKHMKVLQFSEAKSKLVPQNEVLVLRPKKSFMIMRTVMMSCIVAESEKHTYQG